MPASPSDTAPGRLYFDLGAEDWQRLDAFEDTFYDRLPVEARAGDGQIHTASAYIVDPAEIGVLSETLWRADWFEEHALANFVDRICGFDPLS